MLKLTNEGYGVEQGIPQLIIAGSSADDIYVMVLFSSFLTLVQGGKFQWIQLLDVPVSIISGILLGTLVGFILLEIFQKISVAPIVKSILLLGISFALVSLENYLPFAFSGIMSVVCAGLVINRKSPATAQEILPDFNNMWIVGEIFLFTIVGASINMEYAAKFGWTPVLVILGALVFRMLGVMLSLLGTPFTAKEKAFCLIASVPKATVQAAIGSVPLSLGLECGDLVLTVSVIAILLTASLGAIGIETSYKKLLTQAQDKSNNLGTLDNLNELSNSGDLNGSDNVANSELAASPDTVAADTSAAADKAQAEKTKEVEKAEKIQCSENKAANSETKK